MKWKLAVLDLLICIAMKLTYPHDMDCSACVDTSLQRAMRLRNEMEKEEIREGKN